MSGGKIDLSVSGGNVNIGNLSQGDGNTLTSAAQTIHIEHEQAFAAAFAALEARHAGQDDAQLRALQAELATLKQQLAQTPQPPESLIDKARALYQRYGWAGDLLKKLYATVLPMLAL